MRVNVDLMGNGRAQGSVAGRIQANGKLNLNMLRPWLGDDGETYVTLQKKPFPKGGLGANQKMSDFLLNKRIQANGTLRRDEWKQLDDAVMEVARQRLGGIDDLISNGLTYNLGNALGTTVLEWHDVNDPLEAKVTMDGINRTANDGLEYQTNYLPIPIIHVDYEINERLLAASRNMGNPMDTTLAEKAARRLNEKLEAMLFTDITYGFGAHDDRNRNKIYSYINFPDRDAVNLSIPWDHSAITAAGILQDVQEMKAAAIASRHYGPYMLYVPTAYETVLDNDYTTTVNGTTLTIGERIKKIRNIKDIKVIDTLPADTVLLVQMTSDVVRLVRGMGVQNVQWKEEGQFITKYKVMTIQVPQIRSDQNGKTGIVQLS